MYYVLYALIACNPLSILFCYLWIKEKSKPLPPPPEKPLSTTATELLDQLNRGGAVIITQVVDPAKMFMYSPRDK